LVQRLRDVHVVSRLLRVIGHVVEHAEGESRMPTFSLPTGWMTPSTGAAGEIGGAFFPRRAFAAISASFEELAPGVGLQKSAEMMCPGLRSGA